MAVDYITIDTTVSGGKGSELRNAITQLEQVRSTIETLTLQMEAMVDGSDYSTLGAKFGVSTNGSEVYNLFNAVNTLLQGTDVVQCIKRLG
jgi:hypothetical protein